MKENKKIYILLFITIISIAVMLTIKTFQNDTFYTIKVGESIFKSGIDMKEHFSWISGLSYTYPHWLYDLAIFLMYTVGGFTGIYVSTIILAAILLFVMYYTTNKLIDDKGISYVLVVLLSFSLKNYITARAQLVSYILFILILFFIEMLRKTGKKKYLLFILGCAVLIANVHAAVWPFIFVLFLPYLVSDFIYYIRDKYKKTINNYAESRKLDDSRIEIEKPKNTKLLLITFCATIFTGFLTPNFLVPFTYLIKTKMGITMTKISEHLPITISSRPEIFVILGIIIFLLLLSNMKIKLKDLFFLFGLSLLTFLSKRSYALFVILALFSIARIVKDFLSKRMIHFKIEDFLKNRVIFVSLTLMFSISGILVFNHHSQDEYVSSSKYPVELSDFILNNLDKDNIKIFNEYNFGSYLLYRGIPVFIDSRADLYTEEFNSGAEIFKDGIGLFNDYEKVFTKYGVTHVILYNSNKLNSVLSHDSRYKLIYSDTYFKFYERLTF